MVMGAAANWQASMVPKGAAGSPLKVMAKSGAPAQHWLKPASNPTVW